MARSAWTFEPENPDRVEFARSMMPLMYRTSEILAAELTKGGEALFASHGVFGISAAKQNPGAQIDASDWKKTPQTGGV